MPSEGQVITDHATDGPVRVITDGPVRVITDGPVRVITDGPVRVITDGVPGCQRWLSIRVVYFGAMAGNSPGAYASLISESYYHH